MTGFVDEPGRVVVLAGSLLGTDEDEPVAGDGVIMTAIGQRSGDDLVDVHNPRLAPLLEFLSRPRRWSDLERRAASDGVQPDVDKLLKAGRLLVVEPGTPSQVLAQFRGVRVVPLGVAGAGGEQDPQWLSPAQGSSPPMRVPALLAAVLWGRQDGEDLPTTVARLAAASGPADPDEAARAVLDRLDDLLAAGLVRVERVSPVGGMPARESRRVVGGMLTTSAIVSGLLVTAGIVVAGIASYVLLLLLTGGAMFGAPIWAQAAIAAGLGVLEMGAFMAWLRRRRRRKAKARTG